MFNIYTYTYIYIYISYIYHIYTYLSYISYIYGEINQNNYQAHYPRTEGVTPQGNETPSEERGGQRGDQNFASRVFFCPVDGSQVG